MKVQGRCHCGLIRFEAEIDPAAVGVCHCTDCQTLTGSAFRVNVRAAGPSFAMLGGAPKTYVKIADSGARRIHAFCPECGTPIYSAATVAEPLTYTLRIGTLEQRAELRPVRQFWCDSALPWAMDLRDVERLGRQ